MENQRMFSLHESQALWTQNWHGRENLSWFYSQACVSGGRYGLSCILPPPLHLKRCWSPGPRELRIWSYLEIGSLQMIKLRWGHDDGPHPRWPRPCKRGSLDTETDGGKMMEDTRRRPSMIQGCLRPAEAERESNGADSPSSTPLPWRHQPADTLVSDFQPPEPWDNTFLF